MDPARKPAPRTTSRLLFFVAFAAALVVAFLAGRTTREPLAGDAPPSPEIARADETHEPAVENQPRKESAESAPGFLKLVPAQPATSAAALPPPAKALRAQPGDDSAKPPAPARSETESRPAHSGGAPVVISWRSTGIDIEGTATLTGTPAQMAEIDPWADPKCQMPSHATEEEVLVSGGRLANVFVRIVGEDLEPDTRRPYARFANSADHQLTLHERECEFAPRVAGVWKSGTLDFGNQDNTIDDLSGLLDGAPLFHLILPPRSKASLDKTLDTNGIVAISAAGKPWMRAYVVVTGNPFFTTTDLQGNYHLTSRFILREGPHTIEAWHERYGSISKRVMVQAGQRTRVDFNFSAQSSVARNGR